MYSILWHAHCRAGWAGGLAMSVMGHLRIAEGTGGPRRKRRRIRNAEARLHICCAMFLLRRRGMTDSEIGAWYRYHRSTVNQMINSLTDEQIRRLEAGEAP